MTIHKNSYEGSEHADAMRKIDDQCQKCLRNQIVSKFSHSLDRDAYWGRFHH